MIQPKNITVGKIDKNKAKDIPTLIDELDRKLELVNEGHKQLVTDLATYRCKVKRTTDQVIPNTNNTIVNWTAEDFDVSGMHDNTTNNTRITLIKGGIYLVIAAIWWEDDSAGVGYRRVGIRLNGATVLAESKNGINGLQTGNHISGIFDADSGDYFDILVTQTSGGNLDIRYEISRFMVIKLA